MRKGRKLFRGLAVLVLALSVCAGALASGVEYDEDGGVWDWDHGTYTSPDGNTVSITNTDEEESSSGSGQITTVHNEDGSITVITNEEDIVQNQDGSITVESGQIQVAPSVSSDPAPNNAAWAQGMGKAAIANGTYTRTVYTDPDGNETEVYVQYLGLARSLILLNGEPTFVDTCTLAWETEAPADKVIAVVSAKNYARLRAKSSSKSLVMDKICGGFVLRVIATGKNWTMVDYNGLRGYVQTSSLTFYANEPRAYRTGWVSTKSGHITGTSTVHVRNIKSGKQREEYRVGTPLTIFDDDGQWVEVDVEGHHCFIKREFVLFDAGVSGSAGT